MFLHLFCNYPCANRAYILDMLCFPDYPSTVLQLQLKIPDFCLSYCFCCFLGGWIHRQGLFCLLTFISLVFDASAWRKKLLIKRSEFKVSYYLLAQQNLISPVFNPGSRLHQSNCLASAETLNQNYNGAHHLQQWMMCRLTTQITF